MEELGDLCSSKLVFGHVSSSGRVNTTLRVTQSARACTYYPSSEAQQGCICNVDC